MNCPGCGLQIADDSKNCPYCGSVIQEADLIIQEPKKEAENDQFLPRDYPIHNEASGWWIFLGISFPLVGLILYFVCASSKPSIAHKVGLGAIIGGIIDFVYFIIVIMLFTNFFFF